MKQSLEIRETGRTVAGNIALLRRVNGLQYKELSEALAGLGRPIPPLGLRRIESYERRVDVDDLNCMATVFNVPISDLLEPLRVGRG